MLGCRRERRFKRGSNQRSAYAATGKCPATESGHDVGWALRLWQSLTNATGKRPRWGRFPKAARKNLPVCSLWKSNGRYRIEQCWTSCSKIVSRLNFLNAYHLLPIAADCCPYFEPEICHNFRQRLMMLRATRVKIQVTLVLCRPRRLHTDQAQLALLFAPPALLLAHMAIAISRVQRKHLHDLPSYTLHCWLLLQVAIGCAALLAAVCLFQEACCTTHSHTQHWPPASAFIDSSLECCRGTGFATWWINTNNSRKDGLESKRSAESGLDEARRRGLDWLFQDHSCCNRDELVRELILRNTGAWDCTALPQNHPLEPKDLEMDD
jgi:hypothetical protein